MRKTNQHATFLSIVALISCTFCAQAQETATLSFDPVSAPPGAVVAAPLRLESSTADLASLVLSLEFNADKLGVSGIAMENSVGNLGKALQHRIQPGKLSFGIFGGVAPLNTGKIATVYWKIQPDAGIGETFEITNADSSAATPAAESVAVEVGGTATVSALSGHHSADFTQDWTFSLSELLRVIQFYNSSGLHCDSSTEDGYHPGTGDTSCPHHNSDYNLPDWKINLSELLRTIQIFNSIGGAYHPDLSGEDGFRPGPFAG